MMTTNTKSDEVTRAVTSFESWASLEGALKGGYVPTVTIDADDSQEAISTKRAFVAMLQTNGYRVWQGSRAEKVQTSRRVYKAARARCMQLKGLAQKRPGSTYDFPGYLEASDKVYEARKVLRKAEKSLAKVSPNHPLARLFNCYEDNFRRGC